MEHIGTQLTDAIQEILTGMDVFSPNVNLSHPDDLKHGDYTTNVALMYSKDLKEKPFILAQKIVLALQEKNIPHVEKIDIAGPGFINITLDRTFFSSAIKAIEVTPHFGNGNVFSKEKTIIEFTDPNPFKEFHIGHLMSNTIGESVSRLIHAEGAELKRACYQGDVGLHVAKAVWGLLKTKNEKLDAKVLGDAYVAGSDAYEAPNLKQEIDEINKKVYERTDKEINKLYDEGRKVSLDYFETIYKKLGTKFDYYFFESESGKFGKEIVEKNTGTVFEKSDGAVIFKGENHGLHTRVFVNSQGLPTYEAKELGLAKIKFEKYPYEKSVVITGNEVNDYFKVLLKVMSLVFPDLAEKTHHISHGMLRFAEGKMSSRKGNIITAESLIKDTEHLVAEKILNRDFKPEEAQKVISEVAIAAIKYSILRQAPGGDIIFDFEKSLSFEGDSGPYLQYTAVRAGAVLEKAKASHLEAKVGLVPPEITDLERVLYRFPEIVLRAAEEFSPHYVVTYLTQVAALFNSWYGNVQIIDVADPYTPYRLALVKATQNVLVHGLDLLGIKVPERM